MSHPMEGDMTPIERPTAQDVAQGIEAILNRLGALSLEELIVRLQGTLGIAQIVADQDANGDLADQLAEVLRDMVDEQCDYMRRNNLGDPEQQHNIKRARELLGNPFSGAAKPVANPPYTVQAVLPPYEGENRAGAGSQLRQSDESAPLKYLTENGERIPPIDGDIPCDEYDPAGPGAGVEPDGFPQCANCGHSKTAHILPASPMGAREECDCLGCRIMRDIDAEAALARVKELEGEFANLKLHANNLVTEAEFSRNAAIADARLREQELEYKLKMETKLTDEALAKLAEIGEYLWPNQTGLPNIHRNCLIAIEARERLMRQQLAEQTQSSLDALKSLREQLAASEANRQITGELAVKWVLRHSTEAQRDAVLADYLRENDFSNGVLEEKLSRLQVQSDAAHQLLSQFESRGAEGIEAEREDRIEQLEKALANLLEKYRNTVMGEWGEYPDDREEVIEARRLLATSPHRPATDCGSPAGTDTVSDPSHHHPVESDGGARGPHGPEVAR